MSIVSALFRGLEGFDKRQRLTLWHDERLRSHVPRPRKVGHLVALEPLEHDFGLLVRKEQADVAFELRCDVRAPRLVLVLERVAQRFPHHAVAAHADSVCIRARESIVSAVFVAFAQVQAQTPVASDRQSESR